MCLSRRPRWGDFDCRRSGFHLSPLQECQCPHVLSESRTSLSVASSPKQDSFAHSKNTGPYYVLSTIRVGGASRCQALAPWSLCLLGVSAVFREKQGQTLSQALTSCKTEPST